MILGYLRFSFNHFGTLKPFSSWFQGALKVFSSSTLGTKLKFVSWFYSQRNFYDQILQGIFIIFIVKSKTLKLVLWNLNFYSLSFKDS